MKRFWLGSSLLILALAFCTGVASAANGPALGNATATVHTFNMESSLQTAAHSATFLMASFYPSNRAEKDKDDFRGKDKSRGNGPKDKFHGAEMNPTAIVIAGLLALSAYFLFIRRKSHTRA